MGRDRKIRTAQRTNIAGIVIVASEKKMNQFIEQAALKDEKRISIDSLLEVLYIIGRSFTVWIYFPLLNTELFC